MILKTHALALRTIPHSNTSLIVIWMTDSGRRIATLMKGARRPKSDFLGQVDLFYRCELLYYRREHEGLHIASACAALDNRTSFRSNWVACAGASYISAVLQHCVNEADDHPGLFDLAETALRQLDSGQVRQELIFWFELQLLTQLGLAPKLDACTACARPMQPTLASAFSAGRGGMLCDKCANSNGSKAIRISPDILALMRRWQDDRSARTLASIRCDPKQRLVFRQILGMFLLYHLDVKPDGRKIAMDMLTPAHTTKTETRP